MNESKLQKVFNLEKSREQKAAGTMHRSREKNRQLSEQLTQLYQYRDEYEGLFKRAALKGIDARILEDYRLFLAKLNDAIERQLKQFDNGREQYQQTRAQWTETWQRKTALSHLIARHQLSESQHRNKEDQKEVDDRAGSTLAED